MLVSVLLPHRHAGPVLDEAVASVLAQEGVELELLLVDDGDPPEGGAAAGHDAEIAAHHAARDPRVRRLATPRREGIGAGDARGGGIVAALSLGLARSRGEVVARMDGDDVCHPSRLAKQRDALLSDPRVGALGCRVEGFPEGAVGEGMRAYIAWQNALVTPEDHARDLFVEAPLCHPSVMLRREALVAAGGFRDTAWAEDYDLWLRLDAAGYALAKHPDVLLRWRHREGRATFTDPRYARARFPEAKGQYLAPKLRRQARPVAVWGAGRTGRVLARALEPHGVRAAFFVDIDPKKIGGVARGVPIVSAEQLLARADGTRGAFLLVALGERGARDIVRARLVGAGFAEGADFLCVS